LNYEKRDDADPHSGSHERLRVLMEKQIQTAFQLPRQYRRADKRSIARRLLNVPT
jgi:hypothetical protein